VLAEALWDRLLKLTLTEPPTPYRATQLSSRLLATALAAEGTPISYATIAWIRHRFGEPSSNVQQARQPNAYAAGGRSVAVTGMVLYDYRAGRLTANRRGRPAARAGQLRHRSHGPMLIAMWLTAPWRAAARLR
jgi:hypothetical protein